MSACERPVSWLLLERYQLGEVSAAERARVAAHVDACPACRADLDGLASDDRPLPPLPEVAPARTRWPLAWAGLAAAAAAIILLVALWAPWRPVGGAGIPPARIQVKGGELALTLIRERDGATSENPSRYLDGDRFRIELTCPPGELHWDVVVFQADQAHFPYSPRGPTACGNRVGLPGAFRLTGSGPVTVCALVGAEPPARSDLVAMRFEALADWSVCLTLAGQP